MKNTAQLEDFRSRLPYVAGATGVAIALGTQVVALDLFDKPSTCQKVWDRLMTGVVIDALETQPSAQVAQATDVRELLTWFRTAMWAQMPAVGEGQEFRCDESPRTHALALIFGESVLHGSIVIAS